MRIFKFLSKDMGIDLGTANTLVYAKGKGIVLREPSVVAIQTRTNEVLAVGNEAKQMIGRTPGDIIAIRPMKDGVIADFDVTQSMLKYFIKRVIQKQFMVQPRLVICVPSGVTEVEKRAVEEAGLQAGAREAYLIEEPMAAAIGAGLPVGEPTGSMVVDIGGGTTEVAVISLGGIVTSKSIRVGGDELDDSIISYVKKEYKLMIGERTAEEIKINIGSAYPKGKEVNINTEEFSSSENKEDLKEDEKSNENAKDILLSNKKVRLGKDKETIMSIRGRDLISGLPKNIEVTSNEIREALKEPIESIIDAIKYTLEKTPPELSADVMEQGIMLTGGGALLDGLDKLIRLETGMPVKIAEEPLDCVAIGTGKTIEEIEILKRVLISTKKLG